jgi:hypothetical protein
LSHPYRSSQESPQRRRRHLPLALRVHVLFGSSGAWFGILWAGLLSYGLISACGQIEPRHAPQYDRVAMGRIVKVQKTDSDSDNHTHTVFAEYRDDRDGVHTVRSYADGERVVGEAVDVKYEHAHPERAVIVGQRTHRFDVFYPVVLAAFGLVGAFIVLWPRKNPRLALRLLPTGAIAPGTVIDRKEEDDGEGTTWRTRFEFASLDRRTYQCQVETSGEPPYKVGATWPVLYDPGWPDRATPIAHLGGAPVVTDDDRVIHTRDHWAYYGILGALVVNAFLFAGCLVTVALAVW